MSCYVCNAQSFVIYVFKKREESSYVIMRIQLQDLNINF